MSENFEEKIDKLMEVLKTSEEVQHTAALQIKDQSAMAKKSLTDKALVALVGKTAKQLIEYDDKGNAYECVYFAARTKSSKIEDGVRAMVKIANDLAEKGLIYSVLSPISSVDLVRIPGEVQTSAIFFYPLVPIEKVEEIKKFCEFSLEESDMPKDLESFEIDLNPGEFIAITRVTHFLSAMEYGNTKFDVDGMLFNIINDHLKMLPQGTKFLGANRCAVSDFSIPYELKFFNPILAKVKRIELDYIRDCETVNDKIEQFNLLTGIRYYGLGNKRLFHHNQDNQ